MDKWLKKEWLSRLQEPWSSGLRLAVQKETAVLQTGIWYSRSGTRDRRRAWKPWQKPTQKSMKALRLRYRQSVGRVLDETGSVCHE